MNAETWVNLGVLLVSAFAAFVAWRQAVAAKRSESSSARHLSDVLAAQQKLASAVARQTEIREAEERRLVKWEAVHAGGERWDIINRTGFRVEALVDSDDQFLKVAESDEDWREVEPDQGFSVVWSNRYSVPPHAQMNVVWIDRGEPRTSSVALRR